MISNKSKEEINSLIVQYATVYQLFEDLQRQTNQTPGILPQGDQKTGVIGEYYAKCYLESLDDICNVRYAPAGNSADIIYKEKITETVAKVQVKCVSAYSSTRTIAPLTLYDDKGEKAFDYLYLIALDKSFVPVGFYINSFDGIILKLAQENKKKLTGLKMAFDKYQGSTALNFSNNRIDDLLKALNIAPKQPSIVP